MPAHATDADYTIDPSDRMVVVRNTVAGSGALNVFLPALAGTGDGRRVTVYPAQVSPDASYSVVPAPGTTDTLRGGLALVNLQTSHQPVVLVADQTEGTWWPEVQ